jgi:hypothetical protein
VLARYLRARLAGALLREVGEPLEIVVFPSEPAVLGVWQKGDLARTMKFVNRPKTNEHPRRSLQ